MTNRHKILNTDICDLLSNINQELMGRGQLSGTKCIKEALTHKYYYDKDKPIIRCYEDETRCRNGECHACISEWLNKEKNNER